MTWQGAQKYQLLPENCPWTSAEELPEEDIFPICNMITFSLDHNGTFAGYAHRHPEDQEVILSPDYSTPGFLPVADIRGEWTMTVSVCSVETPQCDVHIEIESLPAPFVAEPEKLTLSPTAIAAGFSWTPCELHTHTCHSDGTFTPEQLLRTAKEQGLRYIAITDHNTISAQREMTATMQERYVRVAMGIEWTTFYGHVLILGTDRFVDWRSAEKENLESYLERVQAAGGIAGIAHPYSPGEPFCCGCRWEFQIQDWSHFTFLELWSESEPQFAKHNQQAYHFWMERLKSGQRLTGISARDWHGDESNDVPYAVTYLYLDEGADATAAVKAALREGRAYLTIGPTLSMHLESREGTYSIGDSAPEGSYRLTLTICKGDRCHIWEKFQLQPQTMVVLDRDGTEIWSQPFPGYDSAMETTLTCKAGLIRAELRGLMGGRPCTLLLTNPIYIQE